MLDTINHAGSNTIQNYKEQKRVLAKDSEEYNTHMGCTHTSQRSKSTETSVIKDVCFFCGKPPGSNGIIHEAATFQFNEYVHACAVLLEDTELLAKLSTADMVALEAKYHTKCLVDLYNCARKAKVIIDVKALKGK